MNPYLIQADTTYPFSIPDCYTSRPPTNEDLDNLKEDDIILLGIRAGLEDTHYTEMFCAIVESVIEGKIEARVVSEMSLTIIHGYKRYDPIIVTDSFIFRIMTHEEYYEMFE
jgi:hypothetical protein